MIVDGNRAISGRRARADRCRLQAAADDHLDDLRMGRVAPRELAGPFAVAQHGDAIGDLHHLVDVVRDEDDARTGRRDRAHQREELLDAACGQEGRRLVEQHETGTPGLGARELDFLVGADDGQQRALYRGDLVDALVRIEVEAEARKGAPRGRFLFAPVDESPSCRW